METEELQIDPANVDMLPDQPAVYALYDADPARNQLNLRFTSSCMDLRATIAGHFKPTEPDIPLRYFMLSAKPKLLRFSILTSKNELLTRSSAHPLTRSPAHPLTCSSAHPLTRSPVHKLTD